MATYECNGCGAFETLRYFPDCCGSCGGEVSYVPRKGGVVLANRHPDSHHGSLGSIWPKMSKRNETGRAYPDQRSVEASAMRQACHEVEMADHRTEFPVKLAVSVSALTFLCMLFVLPDGMAACTETHSFDVCHEYLYR
ncbi:MAG: hypothetical protein AAAC47_01780 [Pararhizobium sp.]